MTSIEIDCSCGLLVKERYLCYVTVGHAKNLKQYSVAKIMKLFPKVVEKLLHVLNQLQLLLLLDNVRKRIDFEAVGSHSQLKKGIQDIN